MAVKDKKVFFKIQRLKLKSIGFFLLGCCLGLLLLVIIFLVSFELSFQNKIYPGVKINKIPFGGKTSLEVKDYFSSKNDLFQEISFTFSFENKMATLSGQELNLNYDSKLLADQAFLIGRSGNIATALYQQLSTTNLPLAYKYDSSVLDKFLDNQSKKIDIPPQEALFQFTDGKVINFRPSALGQKIDKQQVIKDFVKYLNPPRSAVIHLTVIPVEPKVRTEQANDLGIKELIGEGKSFFRGSAAARIYNLSLASFRLNGQLIGPGEIFSFNQAVGEVSSETGYQQAYIIREKKTVLDDGGGICQVSTTLFRAALNAGLDIEQRQAHAYRVGYYEQGGFGPGLDATVYAPRIDLKIKNDTANNVLVQTNIDKEKSLLIISLYGTNDGRKVTISKPKIIDQVAPPDDLYQDDPTSLKGQVKQVDFAAWGAKVSFDYNVTRPARNVSQSEAGGETEVLQDRTFYSNFQPWQAIFLRGTKE
ncbi:MAG: VanW family protein [Candidatus Gottesmanbacteria bacterium]